MEDQPSTVQTKQLPPRANHRLPHLLRRAPVLAGSIDKLRIGGYAYDIKTGVITTVVAPE